MIKHIDPKGCSWSGFVFIFGLMLGASLLLTATSQAQAPGEWMGSQVLPGGALTHGDGHVYAIVGGEDGGSPSSARVFRRYAIAEGAWEDLTPTPAATGPGAALAYVDNLEGAFIYAFRGGIMGAEGELGNMDFWRYSITDDSWENLADAPAFLNPGGALAWDNGDWIYAMRGRSQDFWRYSISTGSWEVLEDTPGEVRLGGALTFANGDVFAFRGDSTTSFWRYSPTAEAWTALALAPLTVSRGGSLSHDGNDLIYALRGRGFDEFWTYSISADEWSALANTPGTVGGGGALVHDGQGEFYALSGDGRSDFWRYDPVSNVWDADLPAVVLANPPNDVFRGGSLAYVGADSIYAFRGDGFDHFWRYSVTDNDWLEMQLAPWSVSHGGALATDGADFLYAFRGSDLPDFARYSISGDTWEAMANAPEGVGPGGALVHTQSAAGEYVYALRGGVTGVSGATGYPDFWRFNIDQGSWEILTAAPGEVGPGGALAWDGGDQIFALRGNRSRDFWVYSIDDDAWQSLRNNPANVRFGGALAVFAGQVYALSGSNDSPFWLYDPVLDGWEPLAEAPQGVAAGGALASDGSSFIYAFPGSREADFWRYRISPEAPGFLGPASLADGAVDFAYPDVEFLASGPGPISIAITAGNLPPGMTLGPDGLYSGTPEQAGTFEFTITASNANGLDQVIYSHHITADPVAPVYAGPLYLPVGLQNIVYEPISGSPVQLLASGTAPVNWSVTAGALPAGLDLPAAGLIQGTPSEAGQFSFTLTASNPGGTLEIEHTLTVQAAPVGDWEIGAGTGGQIWGENDNNSQDPFNTWYEVSRSQTIILASELTDAGVTAGPITNLALRTSQLPGRATLSNFRVFLQHTDAELVPGSWVTEGWTEVFGPTSIPGADLQVDEWIELVFTTSFDWDGLSNLFIDLSRYDFEYTEGGGMYVRTGLSQRTQAAREDGLLWPNYPTSEFQVLNHIPEMRLVQANIQPAIQSPLFLNDVMQGNVFAVVNFKATGAGDISWSVTDGQLPPGISLSANGEYSGTPTQAGSYTFTVTASNDNGLQNHEYIHVVLERADPVFQDRFNPDDS